MSTNTSGAIEHIVSDFNKLKPNQDFSGVAAELVGLQRADHTHFQANLAEINKQVDMKKLGFAEDFQIVGVKGNQFVAHSEDGKQVEFRQINNMNTMQTADNVEKMQTVGDHGRQMMVRPDGSATYIAQAHKGDSYWRVAEDVLRSRGGKNPNNTQVANFVNELAAFNKKADPNRLAVHEKIEIPPLVVTPVVKPHPIAPVAKPGADSKPHPAAPVAKPGADGKPHPIAPVAQPGADGKPHPIAPVAQPGADGKPHPIAPVAQPGADGKPHPIAPVAQPGADVPSPPPGLALDANVLTPRGNNKDIYNPIAPPGQGQGAFGEEWSKDHGITASRSVVARETDLTGGAHTDQYKGFLNDGHLWGLTQTGFRADETVDKQGLLTHRKIEYDSGWGLPTIKFQTPDGGTTQISHVSTVETTRDAASGKYNTVIEDVDGNRWQAQSGADGRVNSFKAIDKAPADPDAATYIPYVGM